MKRSDYTTDYTLASEVPPSHKGRTSVVSGAMHSASHETWDDAEKRSRVETVLFVRIAYEQRKRKRTMIWWGHQHHANDEECIAAAPAEKV